MMAYSLPLAKRPLGSAGCRSLGRASRVGVARRGLSSARLLEGRYALNDRPDNRPGLGAVLPNVDLTEEFTEDDMAVLRQASHDAGGILVFPNQHKLDTPKQIAFARRFGVIEPHSVATSTVADCPECLEIIREPSASVVFGENWHSDNSFLEQTCSFSILRGTDIMPKRGSNDTLFSSTEAAFNALSPTMQNLLYGLKAYHSAGKAYGVSTGRDSNTRAAMEATGKMKFNDNAPILKKDFLHPIITVHPDTGRKNIFVSPTFTTRIDGMHPDESRLLLDFLYNHVSKPEFCARVSWSKHQVTMWDNRSLTHKGVADDVSERRIVHRVSLRGSRPRSVFDIGEPKAVPFEEVDYSRPATPAVGVDIQMPSAQRQAAQ